MLRLTTQLIHECQNSNNALELILPFEGAKALILAELTV